MAEEMYKRGKRAKRDKLKSTQYDALRAPVVGAREGSELLLAR